jgi:hypothetical protein
MTYQTEVEQLRAKVALMRAALEIFADPDAWYNRSGKRDQIPVKASLIAQATLRRVDDGA